MFEFFSLRYFGMPYAIQSIVDSYVSLRNRGRLEELRAHRQQLRRRLQEASHGPFDLSKSVQMMDEELEVIEAALNRL